MKKKKKNKFHSSHLKCKLIKIEIWKDDKDPLAIPRRLKCNKATTAGCEKKKTRDDGN